MKPKNIEQRKKVIFRFAGFYLASIILIIIIFSAFSGRSLPVQQNNTVSLAESQADTGSTFERQQVLLETGILYSPLVHLQQSEKRFARLMEDSADFTKLETARKLIAAKEHECKDVIDSVEKGVVKYKSQINAKMVEQLVAFSRLALENRNDFYKLQAAAQPQNGAAPPVASPAEKVVEKPVVDKQAEARWQKELAEKNNRVSELESQLKSLQSSAGDKQAEARLQKELVAKSNRVSELESQLRSLQRPAGDKQAEARLQKELAAKNNRVSELESQLKSLQRPAGDKQADAKLQKELAGKNNRVSDLESQLKSLQRENRSLRLALTDNPQK